VGIIGWVFRRKQVPRVSDPVFGDLTYEQGIWTTVATTPGDGFIVTIVGPPAGPSDTQRLFFQEVCRQLSELEQQATNFVRRHADDDCTMKKLSIYAIEISDDVESRMKRFVMELADREAIVIHRVTFASGKPVHYTYDD
jgi:hypothetical protein